MVLHIDSQIVERFLDDELVVLTGGIRVEDVMVDMGLDGYCPEENMKNCGCNKSCRPGNGGGGGHSGGGFGGGSR